MAWWQGAIFIEMLKAIFGIVPMAYEFWRQFLDVNTRRTELDSVLQELTSRVEDMKQQVHNEVQPGCYKKQKNVFDVFLRQVQRYGESAQSVLDRSQEGEWALTRISWVPSIERLHREGKEHLDKATQLVNEGLTYNEIKNRGELLSLQEDQYMGKSFVRILKSGLEAIKGGKSQCIGIYGYTWAGKTSLMKHLHNKIFVDDDFKAVFWGTAPELDPDHVDYRKALQKCVADAMCINLDNNFVNDEVRNAAKIMARLNEIGPGRAIFFLDNVARDFPSFDLLGIPSLVSTQGSNDDAMNCILVFTTQSKDVCNKMKCDVCLKMDLLEEKEAQELFWHEVRPNFSEQKKIQEIADKVANQCARMPLAIIMIARSMAGIDGLCDWRNRLNELMGAIASIHNEDDKIMEQLIQFGYDCLKDKTHPLQRCFLEASKLLANDRQLSKKEIIDRWKLRGLIGMDRGPNLADDQGHTILNQLERMCLLQVQEVGPNKESMVTMNKWIRKMAIKVSSKYYS